MMRYEKRSEIAVLGTLARHWYEKLSAYELSKTSGINVQSVYEALEKMEKDGIIRREGPKAQIDFMHRFSWQFKLLNDMDRLMLLPKGVQESINSLHYTYRDHYQGDLLAAMVIGSAAADKMTKDSDIDMLFIIKERRDIDFRAKDIYRHGELNLIEKTLPEFGEEFHHADVFIIAALRDGIVLHDSDVIITFYQKVLPSPSWESALRRREHLVKVKERLMRELGDKDTERLVDLFRQYLIEMTRVGLIEKREIPGTKADIISKMPRERRKSYKEVTEKTVIEEAKRYV